MVDKFEFDRVLNELADEPFKWGKNDCFHFTARCVLAWHGKDYRSLHPYKTKKEAVEYIKKHGGIERLTTGTLGYSIRAGIPHDGDVVSIEVRPGEIALGFVANRKIWLKTEKRVVAVSLTKARMVWRIR